MKKKGKKRSAPDMRPEYDFSGAVRGKYAKRFAEGVIFVSIDPENARLFPDAAAVNEALRTLARAAGSPRRRKAG